MTSDPNMRSTFSWNAGGWFGSQLGCTLWLVIYGLVLLSKDSAAAWVCIAGFVFLNAWGLYLWRGREQLRAYAGIQRFLLATSVMIAVVVLVVNIRGVSDLPTRNAMVSTYLPNWVIIIPPLLMLWFFFLERKANRSRE